MEELKSLMEMWTPPDIEEYARDYEHDNNLEDKPASEYNWQVVPQFPVSEFLKPNAGTGMNSAKDWVEWFREENDDWSDPMNNDDGRWGYLEREPEINEPVIVVYNSKGEWHLWDGWHRTASSFAARRNSVPAIVGIPK